MRRASAPPARSKGATLPTARATVASSSSRSKGLPSTANRPAARLRALSPAWASCWAARLAVNMTTGTARSRAWAHAASNQESP